MKELGFVSLTRQCYFDTKKMRIVYSDKTENKQLSSLEFKLLDFLTDHEGEVLRKDDIIEYLWGEENNSVNEEQSLVNIIYNLKKECPELASLIFTHRSVGYRFERKDKEELQKFLKPITPIPKSKLAPVVEKAILFRLDAVEKEVNEIYSILHGLTKIEKKQVGEYYRDKLDTAIKEHKALKQELEKQEMKTSMQFVSGAQRPIYRYQVNVSKKP